MRAFLVCASPTPALKNLSNLEVVIAGDDRVAYGANKPERAVLAVGLGNNLLLGLSVGQFDLLAICLLLTMPVF